MRRSPPCSDRCVFGLAAVALVALTFSADTSWLGASELRRTPVVRAVQKAQPAVVSIHGRKEVRSGADQYVASSESFRQVNGMGTGIIIDARGYILTNYHVVEDVLRIQVTMADQRTLIARLINFDPKTDLAVVKIDSEEPLPVITIGTSSDLMAGEPVIAVGNAYGYDHTVTDGIISALHRTVQVSDEQKYTDLIQTDASINPGNSGGPLLNIDGEMIGINVAVRVGAQGIGFAIPVDEVMEIAARLMSVERQTGLVHGITGKTVRSDSGSRFIVTEVRGESPAARAGIRSGDVIRSVDGQVVERALDLERALLDAQSGETVPFEIERDAESLELAVSMDRLPAGHRTVEDRAWDVLGLRLTPINASAFRQHSSRYRGGLKVLAVREDSPAAKQGIRRGDILVGMHLWETLSLDNVKYVLNRVELEQIRPFKFYILRGAETLYGEMHLAQGSISKR